MNHTGASPATLGHADVGSTRPATPAAPLAAFLDDPLAPGSGQFPLTRAGLARPDNDEPPSAGSTRPYLLRFVHPRSEPDPPAFRFCPDRQVAVTADDRDTPVIWTTPNMEWSTLTDNDGDEGPSEDFGNDYTPDHPFQP